MQPLDNVEFYVDDLEKAIKLYQHLFKEQPIDGSTAARFRLETGFLVLTVRKNRDQHSTSSLVVRADSIADDIVKVSECMKNWGFNQPPVHVEKNSHIEYRDPWGNIVVVIS